MRYYFATFLLLIQFGVAVPALAQTDMITVADLGIEDPGLLPTNPFYFLKEFGRTARRWVTFDPLKRVELELRITNEKAAEAKRVQESRPEDSDAITRALENYQRSQDRLKLRLDALQDVSQNPNVEQLVENVLDRSLKHARLFEELKERAADDPSVVGLSETLKEKIAESAAVLADKADPVLVADKLERALGREDLQVKNGRSLEVVERLLDKVPEAARPALEDVRKNFSERLEEEAAMILKESEAMLNKGAMQDALDRKLPELERGMLEPAACPSVSIAACEKDRASEECARQVKELVLKYPRCGFESILRPSATIPMPIPALSEPILCTAEYAPVCGANGKTYSNSCMAKAARIEVKYRGECGRPEQQEPVSTEPTRVDQVSPSSVTSAPAPEVFEFKLEADDIGFYPDSVVTVPKGAKTRIHFIVRTQNVYYGGLRFTSPKFRTDGIKPGNVVTVEFNADEPFEFRSWWPLTDDLKAVGKVVLK